MDLSKFLKQNKLTYKRKTTKEKSSYAYLIKLSSKILNSELPFKLINATTKQEILITTKAQKDKIIEELFDTYRNKMTICYIYPICKPTT